MADDEVEVFVIKGPDLLPATKLDTKEGVLALLVRPARVATMKLLLSAIRLEEGEEVHVLQEHKNRLFWRIVEAEEPPPKVDDQIHVFVIGPSGISGCCDDHSREFLKSVSKPFDFEVEDSADGLVRMIGEELPCKLPVHDYLYQQLAPDSSWRERLIPQKEFWCPAFATNLTAALQKDPLPAEGSEALCQMLWDALVMEEQPAGSALAKPANELVDKLAEYDPVYFGTFNRNWLLGAATSASTIAFYALNRLSRRQHLIAGPFNGNHIDGKYLVLKCTYNIWRYALTLQKNRGTFSEPMPFPGVIWSTSYDGIRRVIKFSQATATKRIEPFSRHEMLGYSRIEYLKEAYRKEGDNTLGLVWAKQGPKVRGELYTVDMQPIGVERKPVNEAELRIAIHQVLLGLGVLHSRDLVHRDIRWRNILRSSSHGWFLIDLETVWKADEVPCCSLKVWDGPIPFREGTYTRQCDLWLVGKLCEEFHFSDSKDFNAFKTMLLGLTPESTVDVSSVLNVSWLQEAL